jgi:hypothetical protein
VRFWLSDTEMRRVLIVASVLAVVASRGTRAGTAQLASDSGRTLYVLSGGDGRSTSSTVDVPAWRVTETVSLLHAHARTLALDPQGRRWVTYSGGSEHDDDRVQVLAASGAPSMTMRTCRNPEAGIAFGAGRAFIACSENGLGGSVEVIVLMSLGHVATIRVAKMG